MNKSLISFASTRLKHFILDIWSIQTLVKAVLLEWLTIKPYEGLSQLFLQRTYWYLKTIMFISEIKALGEKVRNEPHKTGARYQDRAHSVIPDEREYYTHHLAAQQVLRGWGEAFYIYFIACTQNNLHSWSKKC